MRSSKSNTLLGCDYKQTLTLFVLGPQSNVADSGEKKSSFQMKLNCHIHWKADAPKTRHCLMWILVQRHNSAIFVRKWARRYSQWRSLSGHVERIFVHKNWRGAYWQYLVSTGRRYVPHSLVFEDQIISRRADVVWPPWSCDLTPLDCYLWGAVKR